MPSSEIAGTGGATRAWTVERVRASLEAASQGPMTNPGTPVADASLWGLRRAAAVMGAFDPRRLHPVAAVARGAAHAAFAADCISVAGSAGTRRWILRPEIRRETLCGFRKAQDWLDALDSNPEYDASDPIRRMIRQALAMEHPPLDIASLSVVELAALAQVVSWSDLIAESCPPARQVAQRLDEKRLLEPFETLGGTNFVGRKDELRALRSFVDLLEAESALESIGRALTRTSQALTGADAGAFVLEAPGGMGKSALISRFILDHVGALPFVYLDWENPNLVAQETETMLLEIIRQLNVQIPGCVPEDLSKELADALRERRHEAGFAFTERGTVRESISRDEINQGVSKRYRQREERALVIAGNIGRCLAQGGGRPVLIVLDTFERVQRYGPTEIEAVRRPIEFLHRMAGTTRVVVATRASLAAFPLNGTAHRTYSVGPLDAAAAAALLVRMGVVEADSMALAAHVGGGPLSLILAARVYRQQGLAGIGGVARRKWLFLTVSDAEVQGRLYERYLDQIADPRLRRLAHPGLILRRIDADLIEKVLAEPCQLDIGDRAGAEELFEALRAEVALVGPNTDGTDAVRHRADLRAVMLDLMRHDDPVRANDIHRRAIDYYANLQASSSGPMTWARAEEIYHRLARDIDEDVAAASARWIPGLGPHLVDAVSELPLRGRALVAEHLGLQLDEVDMRKLNLDQAERFIRAEATRLLDANKFDDALALLRSKPERSPTSGLHRLEARTLSLLGRSREALAAAAAAIEAAARGGDRSGLADMLLLSAELSYRAEDDMESVITFLEEAVALCQSLDEVPKVISGLELLVLAYRAAHDDAHAHEAERRLAAYQSRSTTPGELSVEAIDPSSDFILGGAFSEAAAQQPASAPDAGETLQDLFTQYNAGLSS